MGAVLLSCCVRGLEETRHFTPELGATIALMLGAALLAGAAVALVVPRLRRP